MTIKFVRLSVFSTRNRMGATGGKRRLRSKAPIRHEVATMQAAGSMIRPGWPSVVLVALRVMRIAPSHSGDTKMRTLFAALSAVVLLAAVPAPAAATPAASDPDAPVFENGPVWNFTEVKTQDGHFDDYMKWLSTQWKGQEEALTDARANEGDIMLAVEFPNMAAFDHSVAEQYELQKRIFGSLSQASQQESARGSIRTILADYMMREAVFK
jgi:hypothetical protein